MATATYLLRDEQVIIIALDAESALELLDGMALLEDEFVSGQLFPYHRLSSFDLRHQQASLFQFLSQLLQLLGHLGVTATRLADLSHLATSEAHIRVSVIGLEVGFKLQCWHER